MPTLKEKIDQFFDKYHAIIDFEELELRANKIFSLDKFLVKKDENEQRALTYLRSAALIYLQAIDNTAKMRSSGDYDFISLDILQFVRDFEDLMQAKHEDSKALEERTPYGGASFAKAVNRIIEETTDAYNKPLHEIWAKNVLAEKYTVHEMKAVAEASIQALQNVSASEVGYEKSKILLNVLMSKAAMEKIRENHGWGYALRHPILNYREKEFLKTLKDTVKEYERRKYPIDLVMNANNKPILESAFEGIKNYKNREKMKNAGIPKSQENVQENSQEVNAVQNEKVLVDSKPKAPVVSKVGAEMEERLGNEYELAQELKTVLPEGYKKTSGILETMMRGIAGRMIQEAQVGNNKFDLEIMNGKDEKRAMIDHVKGVFKCAYDLTQMLYGYYDEYIPVRLVAAQKITDIVMKGYSPVYFAEDRLAEFGNGYVLNHLSQCADAVGMFKDHPAIKEAKEMYNNEKREDREGIEVIIDDNPANVDVAQPIENAPNRNLENVNQK